MTTTTDDKLEQYRHVYGLPGDIRESTHEGVAVRWISVEPPSYEDVLKAEHIADRRARDLADAVLGDADEMVIEWARGDYAAAKTEQARIHDLWDRIYRSSNHPGAFVMRGEWTGEEGALTWARSSGGLTRVAA